MQVNELMYQYIISKAFFLFVSIFIFTGCAIGPIPPCPIIRIDTNTASLSQFVQSKSLKSPDVLSYKAEIYSFNGTCQFDKKGVEVEMDVDFLFTKGSLEDSREVDLYYFVSIPRFYPNNEAKQVFVKKHLIRNSHPETLTLSEKNIKVFIPLDDKMTAAAYDIYVGFQLNNNQLKYNLKNK